MNASVNTGMRHEREVQSCLVVTAVLSRFCSLALVWCLLWCTFWGFSAIAHAASDVVTDKPKPIEVDTESRKRYPKVASINLCADQFLLALADPGQILSLTNLSHDTAGSYYADKARAYPTNKGYAEEVLALAPDLIIAGEYTNRYTLQQLKASGIPVAQLGIANSVEQVLNNIVSVSEWIEQTARGEAMVKALRVRLDAIEKPASDFRRAAIYDPNGYTVGRNSLRGDILERAGWVNVAAEQNIDSYGVLSLETLIRLKPDMLLESPYSPGTFSRAQRLNEHPVLKHAKLAFDVIRVPSAQTICGGPWTVDLIERLSLDTQ